MSQERNNASARKHPDFVVSAIEELLKDGRVKEVTEKPRVVNPLTVSEGKKLRMVLDLRNVNPYVAKAKFKYEDLRVAADLLQAGDYLASFDLQSGYHHVPIHEDFQQFLGFSWTYPDGSIKFFVFTVLPFGLSSASYIFTKLLRPVCKYWRGLGKRCIIYLDDGFLVDSSFPAAMDFCYLAQRTLDQAGLTVNLAKSSLFPSQCLEWLGLTIDSVRMVFRTPQRKVEKLLGLLRSACSTPLMSPRQVARIAGKLVSLELALGAVVHLFTRQMYAFIGSDPVWDAQRPLAGGARQEFFFWAANLVAFDGTAIRLDSFCVTTLECDASATGYGGILRVDGSTEVVRGRFTSAEAETSSTFRELLAIKYSLSALLSLVHGRRITLYTDSKNAVRIIEKGSQLAHLQSLAVDLFGLAVRGSFVVNAIWVPRDRNQVADEISKMNDTDAWGIDLETFDHVQSKFGAFTIDRFADDLNRKVPRFNSRFFCPGTLQVDAFATSWAGDFNWLCPPIKLVGRALRHLRASQAKGVLLVPEWRSAYFWPLLTADGSFFLPFVKDFLLLDPYFISNCSSRSVFSGFTNFRSYALLLDFT